MDIAENPALRRRRRADSDKIGIDVKPCDNFRKLID
jgi:hypothetical protein